MTRQTTSIHVAIACGGTGGHLFPGLAVAEQLIERGCAVTLLVSPKDVDQQAVRRLTGMRIETLPAVGLVRGRVLAFIRGFARSYLSARKLFGAQPVDAVLAMGGFTSAPPVLAGKHARAVTFIHEANTIPGRANRWLARVVDAAFVGFPATTVRLRNPRVLCTGTPVRSRFQPRDSRSCRAVLGLDPDRPTLLVVGGSQGASAINDLVSRAFPLLASAAAGLQCFHLAGANDADRIREAARAAGLRAIVHPFFEEMELALGAATIAISRAGASSLAEFAAMQVPPLLIPFPAATDNHQWHNARAFSETGAARLLDQRRATPELLAQQVLDWLKNSETRAAARKALSAWHTPHAAMRIADLIIERIAERTSWHGVRNARSLPASRERIDPGRGARLEVSG